MGSCGKPHMLQRASAERGSSSVVQPSTLFLQWDSVGSHLDQTKLQKEPATQHSIPDIQYLNRSMYQTYGRSPKSDQQIIRDKLHILESSKRRNSVRRQQQHPKIPCHLHQAVWQQSRTLLLIPYFSSLLSKMSWLTESNAFARSKKIAHVIFLSSIFFNSFS